MKPGKTVVMTCKEAAKTILDVKEHNNRPSTSIDIQILSSKQKKIHTVKYLHQLITSISQQC